MKQRYKAAKKKKQLDDDDLDEDADPIDPQVAKAVGGDTPSPADTSDFYNDAGDHYFTGTDAQHEGFYNEDGTLKDPTKVPDGHKGDDGGDEDADDDDFDDDETTPQTEGGEGDFDESTSFSDPAANAPENMSNTTQNMGDDTPADSGGGSNINAADDDLSWLDDVNAAGRADLAGPSLDLTSQSQTTSTTFQNAYKAPGESDNPFQQGSSAGGGEFDDAPDLDLAPQISSETSVKPPIRPGTAAEEDVDVNSRPGMDEQGMDTYRPEQDLNPPTPEGGGDSLVGGGQATVEEGLDEGGSLLSRTGSSIFQNLAERGQNIRKGFQSVKSFFSSSKSAGEGAGTDLAETAGEGAAEGGGELLAGMGLGDAILGAIPVVGEIGLAVSGLVAIGEGIYHLFHPPTKPKSPTPPPQVESPQSLTMKYSMALPSADNSIDRAASVGAF